MKLQTERLQQICLSLSRDGSIPVPPTKANSVIRVREKKSLESSLLASCPRETWPKDSYLAGCPHPILMTDRHNRSLQELHEALVLAITNIVERWWTDIDAKLPQRMPLEPQEEDLLRVKSIASILAVTS
jgi:hypothetical protein